MQVQEPPHALVAMKLENKHVMLIGGGKEAYVRLAKIMDCGASLTVVCPRKQLSRAMEDKIHLMDRETARIRLIPREFYLSDLKSTSSFGPVDVMLVCGQEEHVVRHLADIAKERKIPFNCSEYAELCDFHFISEYRDGPLQVGVYTGGQGPRLGARLRDYIKQQLPPLCGEALLNLGVIRQQLDDMYQDDAILHARSLRHLNKLCDSLSIQEMAYLTQESAWQFIQSNMNDTLDSPRAESPLRHITSTPDKWKDASHASLLSLSIPTSPSSQWSSPVSPMAPLVRPSATVSVGSLVGTVIKAPFTLASLGVSTSLNVASSAVHQTYHLASQTVDTANHVASAVLSTTKNVVTGTVDKATSTAYAVSKGCIDTALDTVHTANSVAHHLTSSTLNQIKHVKHTTEQAIDHTLSYLPGMIESPLRSVCSWLPLSIPSKKGKLLLLHIGAGDPELLTLKAIHAFQQCHIVIADDTIPDQLMKLVKRHTSTRRIHYVPFVSPPSHTSHQASIQRLVSSYLEKGYTVVRMKREESLLMQEEGVEEWKYYAEQGFKVDFIPVISAAAAETYRDISNEALYLASPPSARSIKHTTHPSPLRLPPPTSARTCQHSVKHYS